MVQLDNSQGFGAHGHDSDCSSEHRVVLTSGNFEWRAQCCQENDQERGDMAAPECEREARKRRERHDSGCEHERKERRPHSEEGAPPPPPPTPPALQDYSRLESERRAERLSRARRPQFGVKRRRAPARVPKLPKEIDTSREVIRCTTPPNFDYAVVLKPTITDEPETLSGVVHHDIDSAVDDFAADNDDPSAYDEAALTALSLAERTRRDERNAHNNLKREALCPDRRLEKISKRITFLKKTIANYEAEYEAQNGHPLTPSERITDVELTQMYETLRRFQAEKRCIKTDPVEYALKVQAAKAQKERDAKLNSALTSEKSMLDVVKDIEEWLEGCRLANGRSALPEANWSSSQLAAEKACVQRALLRLEAARGRPPAHSADRGAARHLYERYRTVKLRVMAFSRPELGGNNGELATIHEHEAMFFNTSVDSSSDSNEKPSDASQETTETPLQSPPTREPAEEVPSSTSSAKSAASEEGAPQSNESLHCLSLEDLNKALLEAKILKCTLRRSIKEYENNFEVKNSRKLQRDDKKGREEDYIRYKTIKARIKLINALINKQKTHTA